MTVKPTASERDESPENVRDRLVTLLPDVIVSTGTDHADAMGWVPSPNDGEWIILDHLWLAQASDLADRLDQAERDKAAVQRVRALIATWASTLESDTIQGRYLREVERALYDTEAGR